MLTIFAHNKSRDVCQCLILYMAEPTSSFVARLSSDADLHVFIPYIYFRVASFGLGD